MNDFINETEQTLAEIWRQLLSIYPTGSSNFFASGGNSLLLIRLSIFIHEQMETEVDVSGLLQNPVFSDMVIYINSKKNELASQYNPKYRYDGNPIPLSYAQKDIWNQSVLSGFSGNYNMPFPFHIFGDLALPEFNLAVSKLMERHRIFSSNISLSEMGEPLIQSGIHHIPLQFHDLSILPDIDKELRLSELEENEFNRVINILNSPLSYIMLVKISEKEYYFYLTIHHMIFDGVSCDIFLNELMSIYENKRLNKINVDFFDYACWENSREYHEGLNQGLTYWVQRLNDYKPLELPFLNADSSDRTSGFISQQVPIKHLQALNTFARSHNTTLFVVFSLALQMALGRARTGGDIIFGAYTSHRLYSDFANALGDFINPVVLKCDFNINQSLSDVLSETHQQITQDFSWQHVPFESIVNEMNVKRKSDSHPFFNVSLVFNENILKQEYLPGALRIKLESKMEHNTVFAFDTDIEFIVHSNQSGLFIGTVYIKNKVGDGLIKFILDTLSSLLSIFPDIDPTKALSSVSLHDEKSSDS